MYLRPAEVSPCIRYAVAVLTHDIRTAVACKVGSLTAKGGATSLLEDTEAGL